MDALRLGKPHLIHCRDCNAPVAATTPTQKRCKACGEKHNAAARRRYQRKKRLTKLEVAHA
jgi:hypothetical protein